MDDRDQIGVDRVRTKEHVVQREQHIHMLACDQVVGEDQHPQFCHVLKQTMRRVLMASVKLHSKERTCNLNGETSPYVKKCAVRCGADSMCV